jgi:hypothetical protein
MSEFHSIIAKVFSQNGVVSSSDFWKAWEYFFYDQITGEVALCPIWPTYKTILTDDKGILPVYTPLSHYVYYYHCYQLPPLKDLVHAHDTNDSKIFELTKPVIVNGIEWEDNHPERIDLIFR